MNKLKLFESLDGLSAYDTGCIDSGIKDEILRETVKNYLNNLDDKSFRLLLSEYIKEYFLNDEALKQGYGIADVKNFIDWLDEYMNTNI